MGEATAKSLENESPSGREIERCRGEIAAIEELLLAGNSDIEGLCMALADWSAELRILLDMQNSLDVHCRVQKRTYL
jgi:hypothetical protein